MKKIWRKNFEIKQTEYVMMSEAIGSFLKFQKPTVDKDYLKEVIMIFANGDNTATYFVKSELRNYVRAILKEVVNDPLRLKTIHDKTAKYSQIFFQKIKEVEKIKGEKQTSRRLIKIFYELFRLMRLSHGSSLATTWFVDADGEDLSNYLIDLIKVKIKRGKLKLSAPETFSVLTTPEKESLAQKEEKERLGILDLIMKDSQASKIFKQKNLVKLENELTKINKNLGKKIMAHYKKWRWTPYTYVGPAYNLDYYLSLWSSLVRQGVWPKNEIKKLAAAKNETIGRRKKLLKDLNLNKKEIAVFDLAAQIVWLKSFRKDVLFYGLYVIDQILKELGRRQGFSLRQMKYIAGQEMKNFRKFFSEELNQRFKFSVIYNQQGKVKIFIGQAAKDFLKKQNFEKVVINKTSELKGTAAFVGRVTGRVKIINLPEEMAKMEKGDIMVSHTTLPSLVPAMKKAAAIVTDDGGITCHAAIVSRELKIPCLVGAKIATQVFKDGDLVEVDAARGVVRVIKKK